MYLDILYTALRTKYDKENRGGIHVSDLTLCPRKSIHRRIEPTAITNKELNFFTSGRAIHEAIQNLTDYHESVEKRFEIEKEVVYKEVQGHVDLYDKLTNTPIECKTIRTKEIKEPKAFHVDQLKSYMAILGSNKGVLLYQCLLHFDDNPFVEFVIEMNDVDRKAQLNKLEAYSIDYKTNLENKTPEKAIYVLNDPNLNWLCKYCPYLSSCKGEKT